MKSFILYHYILESALLLSVFLLHLKVKAVTVKFGGSQPTLPNLSAQLDQKMELI